MSDHKAISPPSTKEVVINRKVDAIMLLGGERIPVSQVNNAPHPHPVAMMIDLTSYDCHLYGHSWSSTGVPGVKRCNVCSIKGHCPACTPIPPEEAYSFYCTRHTPKQNQEAQA